MADNFERAIMIDMPIELHKSEGEDGRRLVAVEASNETTDKEGDRILQDALLKASDYFLQHGHLDIDHLGEVAVAKRVGISDPISYVVGYPTEVNDIGNGRTEVVGEIIRATDKRAMKSADMAETFWASLHSDPPIKWRASIYGFATEVDEGTPDVPRYLVKSISWRSLAFTRRPVNDAITGSAYVVTAKAYIDQLKSFGEDVPMYSPSMSAPRNTSDMVGDYETHIKHDCPFTDNGHKMNRQTFQDHYEMCHGVPRGHAELLSAALMHTLRRRREKSNRMR